MLITKDQIDMENKLSYAFIALFSILEIIVIGAFVANQINSTSFIMLTFVCICGVLSYKLSIDKRNEQSV